MQKGDVLENLSVETMAAEGKCIAKTDGKVVFLDGGAPGDVVDASVFKIKANFIEAKVTAVKQPSPYRAVPFCTHFGLCGGCTWQHIQYETQLFYKQKQVTDNLERIGGLVLPPVLPILPSSKTRHYRNRLDFSFSAHRWKLKEEFDRDAPESSSIENEAALGFHIPRMFDKVFDVKECHLQADPSNAIRLAVRDEALKENIPFFDIRKQTGFLRTLTIRSARKEEGNEDVMVILQVAYEKMEWVEKILTRLKNNFPEITSLQYVINRKKNDTFHDLNIICWSGKPYITETMPKPDGTGSLQFRVGPKSFYQTNSEQAYQLYKIAWQMSGLEGNELVFDLYTGTGTIANFIAGQAGKVIGLEYVKESIHDAKINSEINNIRNTYFYAGDIKDLLDDSFLEENGKPDIVITDPPRAGMHEDVCKMLLKASPKKIIYVSCNPATQARDLKLLSQKYEIKAIQPVDMFPHTMHVENVVGLALKP